MTSRERIEAALAQKEADRVPVLEEFWDTTKERWYAEGLPRTHEADVELGIDPFVDFRPDITFRMPEAIIEENEDFIIKRNPNGVVIKQMKNMTSADERISGMIDSRAEWDEKKRLLDFTPGRVDWDLFWPEYEEARRLDAFVHFNMKFGYERWGEFLGLDEYLIAMADDPGWVVEMHEHDYQFYLDAFDEMTGRGMEFDGARFSDDMGYRGGLIFSPLMYRELFKPKLRQLCDFFHARGMPTVLHSCGNVTALVPEIIETGFDCLNPLEVKAGMDLLELKKEFGRELCLMGGIDVRAMSSDERTITDEIKGKLLAAKKGGGYIFHSDNSIPDNVSLEQFRRVVRLAFQFGNFD